tara:strand:+ start:279 stop:539 length:261 start_codon:yes stop_codon:yes gene_type:complete
MYQQAVGAGVNLGSLSAEHQAVGNPIIHDERRGDGFMGAIHPSDGDSPIYYPNDPSVLLTGNESCLRKGLPLAGMEGYALSARPTC